MRVVRACAAVALAGCLVVFANGRSSLAQVPADARPVTVEADAPGADPIVPAPHFTQHRRFQFPVTLSSTVGILAVQLHASVNRGATWQLYAEQPPHADSFRVETGQDGEYWFAVKTIDAQRQIRPAGETRVQRIVVVDSRPPEIQFSAQSRSNGEVHVKWLVTDPYVDASTFSLSYQSGFASDWQKLNADPQNRVKTENSIGGEYVWTPQVNSRSMTVRLEILDRAQNRRVETQRVFLPRAAVAGKAETQSPAAHTVASAPPEAPTATNATPSASALQERASNTEAVRRLPPVQPVREGIPWPADNQWHSVPSGNGGEQAGVSDNGPMPPDGYGRLASSVNPGVSDQVASDSKLSHATEDEPQTSDEQDQESTAVAGASDYRWPEIAPGEPLRMTQSRRFHLEYDLEALGPDAVSEVQLWGTQDGGTTWEKWNIDADLQSPFDVQVNDEGIYGFRVVIIAANGLAGEVPAPGSPADLWVGVDSTAPTVEIQEVLYGSGAHLGQLDIHWRADDRRLGEYPITLSFATNVDGPWTTIATSLPNSGQYYWELDNSVPKQVHLRLECMDEAGNLSQHITREPVNTAGVFPRARIRSVQPVQVDEQR